MNNLQTESASPALRRALTRRLQSHALFQPRPVPAIHGMRRSARRAAHAEARLKASAKTAEPPA